MEGELKRRIQQLMKHDNNEPVELEALADSLLFKIVDEACKEFPVFWLTKEGEIYSISSGLEKKAIQWFLKWFGDQPLP